MEVTKWQGLKGGLALPAGSCRHSVRTGCREPQILICFDSARKEAITQTFPMGLTTQRALEINLSFPQSPAGNVSGRRRGGEMQRTGDTKGSCRIEIQRIK